MWVMSSTKQSIFCCKKLEEQILELIKVFNKGKPKWLRDLEPTADTIDCNQCNNPKDHIHIKKCPFCGAGPL